MSDTTGAGLLREAAKLMRERAEAATSIHPLTFHEQIGYVRDGAKQKHIASWHPAVALAVAKLLESEADHCELIGEGWFPHGDALAVAREFLGRES